MSRALVLNASYEPLSVVPARRALVLVLSEKAELLHATDASFRSQWVTLAEPSVVRLNYYVKVPYQARIGLSRRSVFARDGHRCQYCGGAAENIDHIVPRSKGGTHTWENVVAACRPCNNHKQDHLLHETTLSLRGKPMVPRERIWALAVTGGLRPDWEPYLGSAPSLSA